MYCTKVGSTMDNEKNKEAEMYNLIKKNKLELLFLNVNIALRIYLSLMVTNCSGERSFSKLKRIKNEQRTSLGQDKLNSLTLLSIEHEVMEEIKVGDIIKKFASLKARKRVRCSLTPVARAMVAISKYHLLVQWFFDHALLNYKELMLA